MTYILSASIQTLVLRHLMFASDSAYTLRGRPFVEVEALALAFPFHRGPCPKHNDSYEYDHKGIAVGAPLAWRKLTIEQGGRSGMAPSLRCDVITDDDGLAGILPCFEAQVVRHEEEDGVHRTPIDLTVHPDRLFTELEITDLATQGLDESERHRMDQYQQLCPWLSR